MIVTLSLKLGEGHAGISVGNGLLALANLFHERWVSKDRERFFEAVEIIGVDHL